MRAIAADEGRYPISAQRGLLGVARSTYRSMLSRPDRPAAPDPAAPAVVAAHAATKGRYGSRKIEASLERSGVAVSRRRVCRIVGENGPASAYGGKRFKVHPGAVNEADVPSVVARGFGGRAPRTHICSDLAYVRVGASWNYVCLLVDLYNREIVGHSAGPGKDARLVKSAFATLSFPISDIEVFHTDRGSEFDDAGIDLMLEAFGIERSLSAKGCPYDNAVDESTSRILKADSSTARRSARRASPGPSSRTTCTGTTTSGSTRRWATCLRSSSERRGCPSRNRPNRCCQSRLTPSGLPARRISACGQSGRRLPRGALRFAP